MRHLPYLALLTAGLGVTGWAMAQSGSTNTKLSKTSAIPPAASSDVEMVERLNNARKEYENSLKRLREHYWKSGDKQRLQWIEQEIMGFHLVNKYSYNLDVQDVPPPTLEAKVNVKEANEIFKQAMEYKDKGLGNDYILNQRRAELLLREVLEKYPNCDKIADAAFQLGDIYESRAFKQYDRSARYYERASQWIRGGRTDARMRAALLYDKQLNERAKAIELYRQVTEHDTNPEHIRSAERRLGELTGNRK